MGVFGDRLRREREMRGVTLEEISESTKISKRSLQAMEEEEFDVLPGGIFNKGFVRAYARFLGIDEEQAVADFLAVSNERQAPVDKFPLELDQDGRRPSLNPKRSWAPIIVALLVLVAVAGAWTFWTKHKAPENTAESQESPAGKTPDQPGSAQPGSAQTGSAPVTPAPDNENKASAPVHQTIENPAAATPDQNNPSAESTSPPTGNRNSARELSTAKEPSSSEPSQLSKAAFTVSVKATEDSWISIVADGTPKMEGILNAEKQRSVKAGRELVLVTGNAGGIEVSYNGKLVAPLGKKQQKRTVTFTPQGIKQ